MGLKVIGAGFGRTGTASLKVALEQLGLGDCYHMSEVFANPSHTPLWINAANGKPDWEAIFDGYGAAVDFPASAYWRELAAYYPDAKVILSVRDPEKWYTSTQETILSPQLVEFARSGPFGEFLDKTVWSVFDGKVHDHDHMVDVFNQNVETAKAAIAPERLLVFEAKEGWAPLCNFLDVSTPDGPYPRVNSMEETKLAINAMMDATQGGSIDDAALGEAGKKLLQQQD